MEEYRDIIKMLQGFKQSLAMALGSSPLLWLDDECELRYARPVKTLKMNDKVDISSSSSTLAEELYYYAEVQTVETLFEMLDDEERKIVFYRFIDHDFKIVRADNSNFQFLYFKTMSYREMEKKFGIAASMLGGVIQRILKKMSRHYEILEESRKQHLEAITNANS
jgi:hypothetical protein